MKKYSIASVVLVLWVIAVAAADDIDTWIKQLKNINSSDRVAAAKQLGTTKDPRAVNPLVSAMRDDRNWEVRLAAEDALVSIGSYSTEPLIQVLKEEKTCFPKRRAARALEQIKDPCATEGLMKAAAEDADCCVRRFAARALGEIGSPEAAKFLDQAMRKKNMDVVSGAYQYYVRKGEPGTEEILLEAMKYCSYDRKMVSDLARCRNDKLSQAATEVAKKHGYPIPADWAGPIWGKASPPR